MWFDSRLLRGSTAIIALVFVIGCGGSSDGQDGGGGKVVAAGDTVSLTYMGSLADGSVFDSTLTGQSFQFVAGAGDVIAGFDEAVIGMALNESKTFTIPDSMAYGQRSEARFRKLPKSQFPEGMNPEVGIRIQLQNDQGRPFPAVVSAVAGDSVTLDLNHPLAGQDLTFEIVVIGIN